MSFPKYSEYKDSSVEWLENIPEHWEVKELKYVCSNKPSNVDKKTVEGQKSVSLCNYTDVYYNEYITADMPFMKASATDDQIEKFTLRAGDVIITKDSESADDIAVSTYVPNDLPNVVCGYHLAMIRPNKGTSGLFIKRLFDSVYIRSRVATLANGLTRMGLSHSAVSGLEIPVPPSEEQTAIANFLDAETSKIDALVAEQRRLIELLKEKRQAVISHAVTNGLNPNAPMKDSGIEWLGEVPEHWRITQVRYEFDVLDGLRVPVSVEERANRKGEFPYYGASGIIDSIDDYLFDEPLVLVCEDGWNLHLRSQPVARPVDGKIWVNNHAHILRPRIGNTDVLAAVLEMTPFSHFVTGTRQPKLTINELKKVPIAIPTEPHEYDELRDFIAESSQKFDSLEAKTERAIELLQERRSALISAAVTGKIDVREYAAQETV